MNKQNSNFDTLSQAINELRNQGYTEDFNLKPYCLECASSKLQLYPEDFKVDSYYRFEGESDPDDNSILFAISGEKDIKGILVDAYGIYSESFSESMIEKLKMRKDD